MKEKILENVKKHDTLVIFGFVFLVEMLIGLYMVNRYGTTIFDIDAISYLYNSRNVLDKGEYSGLSVLVGTWLPMFQMELVPFTMVERLYTTGLAGTIVNAVMTAGSAVFLYRIAGGRAKRIAVLAPILFMSNIYVILFGIIPMSEQTAIFFTTAAVYYFRNYLDSGDLREFINCSFVLIFGSLTRYEVWIIALYIVGVFTVAEIRKRNLHRAGYAPLPLLGMAGWLFANFLIHRDALWFSRNPLSVGIGQGSVLSLYPWLYYFKNSLALTLGHAYVQMDLTFGVLLYAAAISFIMTGIRKPKYLIALLVFFIPAAVNVFLMYRGESIGWQRYFYTAVPGIVLLNVALLDNVVWIAGRAKELRKSTAAYGKRKLYDYSTVAMVLILIVFVSIASAGLGELNGRGNAMKVPGATLTKQDNRPWIFQGLDITNSRVEFSIESDKGKYDADLNFDILNILPSKDFRKIRNIIGEEKILMPYPDTSGYHPNLFSVSQGVSPSQIIDDFNYLDYRKIMVQPWKYGVRYVLVPLESPSAESVNQWYNGTFYLYNYDHNETWRSEFLTYYDTVLDNESYKLFRLKDQNKD